MTVQERADKLELDYYGERQQYGVLRTMVADVIYEAVNDALAYHAQHFEDMEVRERELGQPVRAEAMRDAALHLRLAKETP